jgi:beta-lactamase superfamily II metal-dependent hydrolase
VSRLRVDAFKLSHHGSRANITEELLRLIDCDTFLVSTNGDRFGHPDPETIDLIAANSGRTNQPTIWFNYECATTREYKRRKDITARYGADGYLEVEL